MIYTYILQNLLHNKVIKTSFTSYNYHFVVIMVRTLKLCSYRSFKILLTIVTILYMRFLKFITLITKSLYPLTKSLQFPYLLSPGNHHFTISISSVFSDFTYY